MDRYLTPEEINKTVLVYASLVRALADVAGVDLGRLEVCIGGAPISAEEFTNTTTQMTGYELPALETEEDGQ